MRVPGSSLLGGISWDNVMGRRILSSQLFCGPGRLVAENLAIFAIRGAVAPRHVSETFSTIHVALLPIDYYQQGSIPWSRSWR